MKKVIKNILIAGILYSAIIAVQLSGSEMNFGRQWGAQGTLHQAPTYFTTYQPHKSACCRKHRYQRGKKKTPAVPPTQQQATPATVK